MSISIIIPINKKTPEFSTLFSNILNQIDDSDQLIIANYGGATTQIDQNFFPNIKKIIYYEEKTTETKILNFVIFNYVINPFISIIDQNSNIDDKYVKKIKKLCDKTKVLVGELQNNQKLIEIAPSIKLFNTSGTNIHFPTEQIKEVGMFDESFKETNSISHYLLLLKELSDNGLKIEYTKELNVNTKSKRKNREKEILVKSLNKKRKHKDILKIKRTPATIIIPKGFNINILPFCDSSDKIVELTMDLISLSKNFMKILKESTTDCIILLSQYANNGLHSYNMLHMFKKYYQQNTILLDNIGYMNDEGFIYNNVLVPVSPNKINDKTSICFDKNIFNNALPIGSKDNLSILIKQLIMQTNAKLFMVNPMISKKSTTSTFIISGINQPSTMLSDSKKRFKNKITRKRKIAPKNITAFGMQWKNVNDLPSKPITSRKPRLIFICDVEGWAWWLKSRYLKSYLSKYYDIDIVTTIQGQHKTIDKHKYDLYVTFGHSFINRILDVPAYKRITGVTAHRPRTQLEAQMKKAAVIHANSVLLYNEVKQFHNIVFYVPNGVDETQFRIINKIPKKRKNLIVGVVGKLSKDKRQAEILFPAISQAGVDSVIHTNNYLTRIPHNKMHEIYQKFDVLLCASKEDGTPNPCLEAAACGRPIITNKIGNMPELIENNVNGFIYDSINAPIEWYVEKILELKRDRNKLIEMGYNVRKSIEDGWSWSEMYKNYLLMFDKMLKIDRPFSEYDNPALYHIDHYDILEMDNNK